MAEAKPGDGSRAGRSRLVNPRVAGLPLRATQISHEGRIFLKKNESDEAIQQFNTALGLCSDSEHPDDLKYKCYCGLGEAYLSCGNSDLAIHTLSRATEIQPDSGEAYGAPSKGIPIRWTC